MRNNLCNVLRLAVATLLPVGFSGGLLAAQPPQPYRLRRGCRPISAYSLPAVALRKPRARGSGVCRPRSFPE